jgi:translation initiation factor IF-2
MRVFEFAKELGIETLALMDKIREWKLPVKSHMATLDDALMADIKARLSGPKVEDAPKEAKVKKKVVAAKPKAKTTKTVLLTRKAGTGAETATTVIMKQDVAQEGKATVVSRKSTVVVKKKKPEPEEELREENESASADSGETATASGPTSATETVKRRGNIIGKMDLSKARPPSQSSDLRSGPRPGGAQRNIRAGFFAEPLYIPDPEDDRYIDKDKARDEKTKRPGAGREEPPQVFNAADFRKREVVFQPKKKKIVSTKDLKKTVITTPKASKRVVRIFGSIKVGDLAQSLGQKSSTIIKHLMAGGVMATINSDIDFDTAQLICSEFQFEAENVQITPDELIKDAVFGNLEAEVIARPPVVTVMGHVDHGKTSLLDAIRKTDVAAGEAGGITQHIGAYKVVLEGGQEITFLDTPGHEAFTAMRARGANATDIAIIVVAADDGVMPQTVEAINHAKAAQVPIIIAVNKIDKPGANIEKIKQQLTEYEIVPEEWGGTHIFCPVSALKKEGIKELLEQVLLVAEVEDLKANPKRSAEGVLIEARLEKGRGPVGTVLIQDGTLKVGDVFVAGRVTGRVRAMMNDRGEQVKEAIPGDPVEVLGFSELAEAGDQFNAVKDEASALHVASERKRLHIQGQDKSAPGMTLEDLFSKVKTGEQLELPIVLKADVSGSLEALRGMLDKTSTDKVKVKVIHTGVGGISESDVLLASTAKGLIIGFNVRPDTVATNRAKDNGIEIKTYTIVYNLVDDIKKAMAGLLKPERVEKVMGRAEVREVFTVPKFGSIAGSTVIDGKITRNDQARLVRDGIVVFESKISSLRRFKDDVREVQTGYECGIGIENFNDIKVGDLIEAYIIEEKAREL